MTQIGLTTHWKRFIYSTPSRSHVVGWFLAGRARMMALRFQYSPLTRPQAGLAPPDQRSRALVCSLPVNEYSGPIIQTTRPGSDWLGSGGQKRQDVAPIWNLNLSALLLRRKREALKWKVKITSASSGRTLFSLDCLAPPDGRSRSQASAPGLWLATVPARDRLRLGPWPAAPPIVWRALGGRRPLSDNDKPIGRHIRCWADAN